MKKGAFCNLILAMILANFSLLSAQENLCKLLDRDASRLFVPDRIPLETELVSLDSKNAAAIQFPDKSRFAFVSISAAGNSSQVRARYQYVLISETTLQFGSVKLSPGMVGFSLDTADKTGATLVAREVSGVEMERLAIQLDAQGKNSGISLEPKGPKEFELHLGKYVIQGAQK